MAKKIKKIAVEELVEGDTFLLGGERYIVTEDAWLDMLENETIQIRFISTDLIGAKAIGYRQLWKAREGTIVKITRGE